MAQPRGPGGERHSKADPVVRHVGEPAEAQGDVHVGGGEQPRPVELLEQAGDAEGQVTVVAVELPARLDRVDEGHGAPRSKSSLKASMSAAGGRHDQTPHGCSSTTVGSNALMPRTKR